MNYLDYAANRAATLYPDLPVATQPGYFCDSDVAEYGRRVGLHMDDFVEFAARTHNADPSGLSALAVRLRSFKSINYSDGLMRPEPDPNLQEGVVHYPVISLAVVRARAYIGRLNGVARHEAHHIYQEKRDSMAANSRALRIVQAAGGVATAGFCLAAVVAPDAFVSADMALLAATAAGSTVPSVARVLLWPVDTHELGAARYSRRHHDFRPFEYMIGRNRTSALESVELEA